MDPDQTARLVKRLLQDVEFRAALLRDPANAAAEAGYTLTEDQIAAIRHVNPDLTATELEERLSRFWGSP